MARNYRKRKSGYREAFAQLAYNYALLGATLDQMAEFFGCSPRTLDNWLKQHSELAEAYRLGRAEADALVAQSLYHRARGYSHPEEQIFCARGEVTRVETVKHYPPDTLAAKFWLMNRQPERWRDKVEHAHAGKDGGPIPHHVTVEFVDGKK